MTAMKEDAGKRGLSEYSDTPALSCHSPIRTPSTAANQLPSMPADAWGWPSPRRKGSVSQPLNWPASHVPSRLRKRDPLLHPSNSTTTRSRKEVAIIIFASPQDLSLVLSVVLFRLPIPRTSRTCDFPLKNEAAIRFFSAPGCTNLGCSLAGSGLLDALTGHLFPLCREASTAQNTNLVLQASPTLWSSPSDLILFHSESPLLGA